MNEWLAKLPGTNAVIATGIMIAFGTALRYQLSDVCVGPVCFAAWVPTDGWLMFCTGAMSVAAAQFGVKRVTYQPSPPAPPDIEDKASQPEPEK